ASYYGLDFSQAGSGDGTLVDVDFVVDSPSNWIDVDIGLTFTAQLTGLPLATINITADRTGFEAGTGTLTISYGNRKLEVSANGSNLNADDITVDGDLTITNQDGVMFKVSNLAASGGSLFAGGELTYNGNKYGDVTETDSGYLKVKYNDGTIEIF
ncbi:MAG: hypothetical protein LJE83_06940, partial [Gammaproteobacteria bacterium]|nr:hypothetical protein [Gammaproteobacteria bacterium]